jgi:hypothetical protein
MLMLTFWFGGGVVCWNLECLGQVLCCVEVGFFVLCIGRVGAVVYEHVTVLFATFTLLVWLLSWSIYEREGYMMML